jgi:hypothetical protein
MKNTQSTGNIPLQNDCVKHMVWSHCVEEKRQQTMETTMKERTTMTMKVMKTFMDHRLVHERQGEGGIILMCSLRHCLTLLKSFALAVFLRTLVLDELFCALREWLADTMSKSPMKQFTAAMMEGTLNLFVAEHISGTVFFPFFKGNTHTLKTTGVTVAEAALVNIFFISWSLNELCISHRKLLSIDENDAAIIFIGVWVSLKGGSITLFAQVIVECVCLVEFVTLLLRQRFAFAHTRLSHRRHAGETMWFACWGKTTLFACWFDSKL